MPQNTGKKRFAVTIFLLLFLAFGVIPCLIAAIFTVVGIAQNDQQMFSFFLWIIGQIFLMVLMIWGFAAACERDSRLELRRLSKTTG